MFNKKKADKILNSKRYIFHLILLFSFVSCTSDSTENEESSNLSEIETNSESEIEDEMNHEALQEVVYPENYEIVKEAFGDLDGDGIDERVIVFNTDREVEYGTEREIRLYINQDGFWSDWCTSIGAVLSSEAGGIIGDPFELISIHNQHLVINHYGGSEDRWSFEHQFQFQNEEWELVAATLNYYNICNFSETYTYDLEKMTGYHSRQKDECDENGAVASTIMEVEETLILDQKNPILMNDFKPGETMATVSDGLEGYFY